MTWFTANTAKPSPRLGETRSLRCLTRTRGVQAPEPRPGSGVSTVSTELPVYPGDVSPLRASFFGGWTDGHQAAFTSDLGEC